VITGGALLANGTTPLTANWNAGNYSITSRNALNVYNVLAYGADSTGVSDSTTAIQTAATAAAGGTLYFPSGTYKITSGITISSGTVVRGDGISSVINASGGSVTIALGTNATTNVTFRDLKLTGSFIDGIGATNITGLGVYNCDISGATLTGATPTAGIYFSGATRVAISNNHLSGNGTGDGTHGTDIYGDTTQNTDVLVYGNRCSSTPPTRASPRTTSRE